MAVVITTTGAAPTVGADFDTWGGENNANIATVKVDLDALAAQGNASDTLAAGALQKAGGTMTGDLLLATAGPTSVNSAGFLGSPPLDFSVDKTLALTDAGITQRLTGATARVLTIPPSIFPLGTVIPLRNSTGVVMTVARGSGVTLTVVGSATNANASLAARGSGALYHESTNVWTIQGVGVS